MDNYMGLQWSLLYIYIRTLVYHIYIVYIFDISLDCNRLEWKIAVAGDIGQTGRLLVDVPARRMPVLAHEHGTAERVFFAVGVYKKYWLFMGLYVYSQNFQGSYWTSTSGMAGMPALAGKHHRGIARLIEEIIHKKTSS